MTSWTWWTARKWFTSLLPTDVCAVLKLRAVNRLVFSVHLPDGSHVGNLKHIGAVWKFKAVGYDAAGAVIPGGGPYTEQHNTQCLSADAQLLSAALGEPAR